MSSEQARAALSTPTEGGEVPVAWTLRKTLEKRETTTRAHLWFSDPVNCCWAPLYARPTPAAAAPIDMLLFCPKCGMQHVDAPEQPEFVSVEEGKPDQPVWNNRPHRSHLCHGCGCIWRPADVPTNGVAKIATTGKADNWHGVPPDRLALAKDIKDAIKELADGRSFPDLMEAVDMLAASGAPPEPVGINGLTEAETSATASVMGLVSAAVVPSPSVQQIATWALEAIEAGASAPVVMNVEGVKDHLRRVAAHPLEFFPTSGAPAGAPTEGEKQKQHDSVHLAAPRTSRTSVEGGENAPGAGGSAQ